MIALRPSELVDPPLPPGDGIEPSETPESDATETSPSSGRSARIRWAQLLARIYEVLPLLCPRHRAKRGRGGQMRILAFLTDPPVVQGILLHPDLPHRPPPVSPARGPPQGDFLLDQSPEVDLVEAEPAPAFDFDPSAPEFEFDQSLPDPFGA